MLQEKELLKIHSLLRSMYFEGFYLSMQCIKDPGVLLFSQSEASKWRRKGEKIKLYLLEIETVIWLSDLNPR